MHVLSQNSKVGTQPFNYKIYGITRYTKLKRSAVQFPVVARCFVMIRQEYDVPMDFELLDYTREIAQLVVDVGDEIDGFGADADADAGVGDASAHFVTAQYCFFAVLQNGDDGLISILSTRQEESWC